MLYLLIPCRICNILLRRSKGQDPICAPCKCGLAMVKR